MKKQNTKSAGMNRKMKGRYVATRLALMLVVTLLAESLQPAGNVTVYAASGGEEEAITDGSESGAGETGNTTEADTDSDTTSGGDNGTNDPDAMEGSKGSSGDTESTEPGAGGGGSGTSQDDETVTSDPAESEIPADTVDTQEEALSEEEMEVEESAGEQAEEEIITFFESEEVTVTSSAMMASVSSAGTEDYDPTSLYAWVHPAPRSTDEGRAKGVPNYKTLATKSLSDDVSEIAQWDHIYFGMPNRVAQSGNLYYDYGEENVWLDHIRWRVLDPERDNTALNVAQSGSNVVNVYDENGSDDAMFVMAEGLFARKPSDVENNVVSIRNYDGIFSYNQDSSYSTSDPTGPSTLAGQWLLKFPQSNFTAVEETAVKVVSKTESLAIKNTSTHGLNNPSGKQDITDPETGMTVKDIPKPMGASIRTHSATTLNNARVFFLSASEALYSGYGFAGNGVDGNGNTVDSGYILIYQGLAQQQYIMDPICWDTRILPWKGYRFRGSDATPPYTYGNSVSWRLRNNNTNAGGPSIVLGMNSTWYASTAGVSGIGAGNPIAFRPGMNIKKSNIIFISEAENGKNENDTLTWLDLNNQTPEVITEYKLTLVDEDRASFTAEIAEEEGERYIRYQNAKEGNNEYISVLIREKDGGAIRYYGRIGLTDACGGSNGQIPLSVLDGYWRRGYADELYVFSEQHNPARESDYASIPQKVIGVDADFSADTDELHWAIRPEYIQYASQPVTLANAAASDLQITEIGLQNENGTAHTDGYYRLVDAPQAGDTLAAKSYTTFRVIPAGKTALYQKNTILDPIYLVIKGTCGGEQALVRVKLTCTVLRSQYELIPDGDNVPALYFGLLDPEAIPDGTMAVKEYKFENAGRQDLYMSATLSGEYADRFEIRKGAEGLLQAAPAGSQNNTHIFGIGSKQGAEEIPEGRYTFYLDVTAQPAISANEAVPEEERPAENPAITQTFSVPLTFRISPKTYRVETDADAVEMDDCYPEDVYEAPEQEVVFSNTGRYPVKMTVDDLTEEEKVYFTIQSVRSGDNDYKAGDEISVGVDEAVTVTLKAVKSEVHATRNTLYQSREALLHMHAVESDDTNGAFIKDVDVAVFYKMYPQAVEWKASPELVNFGSVMPENMASTPEMVISVTNTGRETVTLSDLVIAGDGKAAFRFKTTPRANNPIEPGETIEESVKLYSGMTDGVEYNAEIRAKINGSTDREKICDLRVYSGKAEYELTPRVTYVDFYMDPENMESARTAITFENTGRKVVKVKSVKIVSDDGEERFQVTGFKTNTSVNEKGRLDFYIKPNTEDVNIGQEFSAKLYLETDPAEAFTGYVELHMYMDQVMYLMNRELPQNTDTLEFEEILPEMFDPANYSETIRFANSGREELHITGIDFDGAIADYFTRDIYVTDKEGNRQKSDLEEGTRILFPTESKLEIVVRPVEEILEFAGKDPVTGAIHITTAEMQKEQNVNLDVTVARYPYQIKRDADTFDLGDYYPEEAAPEKTVTLENIGRNEVCLLAPEMEEGNESLVEIVSVVIDGTSYTDFTSPLLFPKDSKATITVRAVSQEHMLAEPESYSSTITVRAVTEKDADPQVDAIDPIVLTASYNMYASKFQTETSPATVSFTENVEPYQLDEVEPITVIVKNTGRMTLVPAGEAFEIGASDAFTASDYLVNGEVYDAETNPFKPDSFLSFQVRPKDDLEENTTYTETLQLPLKTVEDVLVLDRVLVPATISVPLPKERLQSDPDETVAVDFGKLAPVDDYKQPVKRSVRIKNTGRDTVIITGVTMDGEQAYAFEDVIFSGPVTLKTDEFITVYVQPKAQPEDPEQKFEQGSYEANIVANYTSVVTNMEGNTTIGTAAFEINKKDYHIAATVAAAIERGWKVWDGTLPMVNPEEEPEEQKITLRNIGNESVTVTDAMLTAGTAHFTITGSSPVMPATLAPDAEMTITVLPYDLEAENTYYPKMRIYTDPDEAAFTVSMTLKVPKMPYILSQGAQSFTYEKVTAVNPGETYMPESKTLIVSNGGRENVTVTEFTFTDGDESGFEIVSVKNGESEVITGQESIRGALPLTIVPDTDLVIVVAPKAFIAEKPGTTWKNTLSVNIAETENITCDLDVAVDTRDYDLQFTEQNSNEPVEEKILLGDEGAYYPEGQAPSVTVIIRNTGKKNVELQPIAFDPSVVSVNLRVGGKPYHEELNYTLKGSENTSKAGDQEATLTITAIAQHVDVYGSEKKRFQPTISVIGIGEGADATEHTKTSFDVLFDMYSKKYAVQVTEGTADFDDVGHEALGATDEKVITVKNIGRENLTPAENANGFALVSEQGIDSVFTIGQGIIDGKPYDTADNPFKPGKELSFTVKPKKALEEKAEYAETLTASFAAGNETITADASARIRVLTTAYRLETDRPEIDFGVRSKGETLPDAETFILRNTGRYGLSNVQLSFADVTRTPLDGGDAVSVADVFTVKGNTGSISASGSVQISVRPDLDLSDNNLEPGIYRAKLKLTAEAEKTPATPDGDLDQHIADVVFWVGERPYYLVPDQTAVAFNEEGSPVAPETANMPEKTILLKNMGANVINMGDVQIELAGTDAASFTLHNQKNDILINGEETSIIVSPVGLIPEKSYRAEIVITFPDAYNHQAIRIPVTMEVDKEAYAAVIEATGGVTFADIDPDDTSYEPEKKTFTIRNVGKGTLIPALTITRVNAATDKDAFAISVTVDDQPYDKTDNPFEPGKTAVISISPKASVDGFTPDQKYNASLTVGFIKPGENAQDNTLQSASIALSYRVLRETYAWDTRPAGTKIDFAEIDPDQTFAAETRRVTIINNGREPLTIVDAWVDGDGKEAFEIDADSLIATRLESQDVSALDSMLTFTVKTKQHDFEEGKTYDAKIMIRVYEEGVSDVEIPLSVASLRRSYAPLLGTESVIFQSEMDGSVEEGIEPENVLTATASLELTNNGRDALTITNVRFTGTYRSIFTTDAIPVGGITLDAEHEGTTQSHTFTVALTDKEYNRLTTREDVSYGASMVIDLISGDDNATERSIAVPVHCYVRQKQYRIETNDSGTELGIADYAFEDVSGHVKEVIIRNTGRDEITIHAALEKSGESTFVLKQSDGTPADGAAELDGIVIDPGDHTILTVQPKAYGAIKGKVSSTEDTNLSDKLTVLTNHTSGTDDRDNYVEINVGFTVRKPHYQIATDVSMINFGWISGDDDQDTLDEKQVSVTVTNIGNIDAKVTPTLTDNEVTYEKADGTEETVNLFELVTADPETVNRYETATFTVKPKSAISGTDEGFIPAGSYQAKLLFEPETTDGSTVTDASAVQEVILYLWVQEKPDETDIQIEVSPASVDLGEAYNDYSDVDESAPEKQLTIINKTEFTGNGDGSLTLSAEINPEGGAFELVTPADFSEAVSSGDTRTLTVKLREDQNFASGSYMAIVTIKATGTANTSKSTTAQIPVMIRIKDKPTEEIKTYGIATDTELVEFDKVGPQDKTPAAVPVTIQNTGTGIIRVNGVTLTDEKVYESVADYEAAHDDGEDKSSSPEADKHFFRLDAQEINLAADASCIFTVRPEEGFEAGKVYTANVLITTDRTDVQAMVKLLFSVWDAREDISIVPSGVVDFGENNPEGSTVPAAKTVRITNDGNITIYLNGIASVSGSDTTDHYAFSDYYLGNTSVNAPEADHALALAPGETFFFTVQPVTGLPAGNYTEKIVVSAEGNMTVDVPASYRVLAAPEEYSLQTDKPFVDLGEVPSDYTAQTLRETASTLVITNNSTHPVILTRPTLDSVDAFEILSYTVNGVSADLSAQDIVKGHLLPGETAEVVVTATENLAENCGYDTVLRVNAYKEEDDPQENPDAVVVATAIIPIFFRVSATPSDAYVMEVTESLSFEADPESNPLSEEEIKKIDGQSVTIKNKGSRDITVTEVALSGEEAENRFTLHAFTHGNVSTDTFAETTLAPGETLVFTAAVNGAYTNFSEKAVYEAALTVKTNRNVGEAALSAEIPVTFTVLDQLPDGIWMEDIPDQTYTGVQIKPAVKVYYGRKELTAADYSITYKNNTNAAPANAVNAKGASVAPSVIVKGKGTYTGQITKTFTITPLDIRDSVFPADDAVHELNADPEEGTSGDNADSNTVSIRAVHLVMNQTNKAVTKVNLTPTYTLPSGKSVKLTAKDFVIRPSEARLLVKDDDTNTYAWSESAVEMKNTGIYKVPVYGIGNYAGDGTPRYVYVEVVNTNKKLGAVETRTLISKVTIPAFPAQTYSWGDGKAFVYQPKNIGESNKKYHADATQFSLHVFYQDTKKGTVAFDTNITDKTNKSKMGLDGKGKQTVPYPLVMGKDYLVTYANNDRVGTASITITGIGDYYGSVTKTFKINGTALSKTEVAKITGDDAYDWIVSKNPALDSNGIFAGGTADGKTYVSVYDSASKAFRYTGAAYEIAGSPDGTDNAGIGLRYNYGTKKLPVYKKLVKGTDYTVSYTGNTNPGTATVIFTGVPERGYTGTLKRTFKICGTLTQEEVKVSLTGDDGITDNWTMYKNPAGKMVQEDPAPKTAYSLHSYGTYYSGFAYQKGGVKPKPVVTYGNEVLTEGVDYKLTWQNNNPSAVVAVDRSNIKKFKQPTVTVTGLGRFKGSNRVVKFDIYINDTKITLEEKNEYGEDETKTVDPWTRTVTFAAGDVAWKSAGASSTLKPALTLTDTATGTALKSGTDYYPAADKKVADTNLLIQYYYVNNTTVERLKVGTNGKVTKEKVSVTIPAGSAVSRDAKRTTNVDANGVACLAVADDIIPAGTRIRVVVTGKGFYEGQKIETTFRYINNNVKNATPEKVVQDISKMTVSIPNQQWTGKAIVIDESNITVSFKAKETVKVGNKTKTQTVTYYLEGGRDFEIVEGSFANNVNTGTAKVTIRGIYDNGRGENDKIGGIAGVKTVTFKIVARQMSYSLSYQNNNEAFAQAAAEFVKLYGTDEEKALVVKAKEEGKAEGYYLGAYFRVTGTMAKSTTAYGSALPANKFTVQRKVVTVNAKTGKRTEKWTTMNAKKDHAILFSEWTLKENLTDADYTRVVNTDGTEETVKNYESFVDKGLFIFRQSAWYNNDTGFGGSLIGNWYRKLVYGDGMTLHAQWEVK